MDKLKMHSKDKTQENFEILQRLFPNAVTETITGYDEDGKAIVERAIDKDVLQQEINAAVVEGKDERYQFTWPDKKRAIISANAPINKTLRPCREESVDFDNTENLYIEGDNLEVLKLLQETYLGKIKMIYIDPPYNTGHDFVYNDKFSVSADEWDEMSGELDEYGNRLTQNTESNGRFHTDWLNMIYPRLKIARDLLTDDGVIFISIDDNEVDEIFKVCNEVFGKERFLACFPRVTKRAGKTTEAIAKNHDYILVYCKTESPKIYLLNHTDEGFKYTDEYENERGKYKLNQTLDYDSLQYSSSLDYPITVDGETYYPGQSYEKYLERKKGNHSRADWAWRWSKELFEFGYNHGFIVIKKYKGYSRIYTKTYQNAHIIKNGNSFEIEYFNRTRSISTLDYTENLFSNDNAKKIFDNLMGKGIFDYTKPVSLLENLTKISSSSNDIILDFFSGSATTAHAVMKQNFQDVFDGKKGKRKFIMVQLPEKTDESSEAYKAGYKNICEIGKERIRRAGKNEYLSVVGTAGSSLRWNEKRKAELGDDYFSPSNVDIGFRVLKLDSSNMKDVYYNPADFSKNLLDTTIDNIKEDRTAEDLLFQVMLDLGVLLSSKIVETEVAGKKIFNVSDGYLMACFDEDVNEEVITAVAKQHPIYFVMRDSSLSTDTTATNFDQIFETYSPDTVRKVI